MVQFNSITTGTGTPYNGTYDSRLGYQYTSSASPPSLVNRFGPVLPFAIELVVIAAPPKIIQKLTTIPAPVSSGDSTKMWADVDEFVGDLPAPVGSYTRIYSTIVPLSLQP